MQFSLLFGFLTFLGISISEGILKKSRGDAVIVDDIHSMTCVDAVFDLRSNSTEDQQLLDGYCSGLPPSNSNNRVPKEPMLSWSFQKSEKMMEERKELEEDLKNKKYLKRSFALQYKRVTTSLFVDYELPDLCANETIPDWIAEKMGFAQTEKRRASWGITITPESCKDSILRAAYCFRSVKEENIGVLYEVTDPGYFTNNDTIYHYHLLPHYALQIANGIFVPVDYETCKQQGARKHCEALATKCTVDNLEECPIHVFRADQDFVHSRSIVHATDDDHREFVATRLEKMRLYKHGKWTERDVPSKLFVISLEFWTKIAIGHGTLFQTGGAFKEEVEVFETKSKDFSASELSVLRPFFNEEKRWEGKRSGLHP